MRFAYADPPYPGMEQFYDDGRNYGVNHVALLAHLEEYDGWALSTASTTLAMVLPLCADGVRIAAWVKPFASFKKNVDPAYAWEPVLFRSARTTDNDRVTVRDYVSVPITLRRGFIGAKPTKFVWWMLDLIGWKEGDDFVDLFPGSGAVSDAYEHYQGRLL